MNTIEYLHRMDLAFRRDNIEKPAGIVLSREQIKELREYFWSHMGIELIVSQPFYIMGFTIFVEDL